jgi:hypothetical protein
MKIIKKLVITNLLFLAFNSFADPFDAFKEIAKELDKSVNQKQEEKSSTIDKSETQKTTPPKELKQKELSVSEQMKQKELNNQNILTKNKNRLAGAKTFWCKFSKMTGGADLSAKEVFFITMLENKIIATQQKLTPANNLDDAEVWKWFSFTNKNGVWSWGENYGGTGIINFELDTNKRELFYLNSPNSDIKYISSYKCNSTSPL